MCVVSTMCGLESGRVDILDRIRGGSARGVC